MVKISQISEPYISWIYEFQLLSLTLALVHNAQNFDQGIDYLWTSLTAGKVHCLKSQGWNRQISHCTFECKHGTYDSLLPNSVPVVSRYVTFSPFSTLPPSVLHNIPHNLRQLLSFGLCHVGLLFFFSFLLSYLKCSPLQLFFSVCLALFLSTCPFLLYVPSLFFKLDVSFHGVARESRESRAVDGFGGEDLSSLWTHHGTDRVKEGQRHTCTQTNANARSCSFQISFEGDIIWEGEGCCSFVFFVWSRLQLVLAK